MPETAVFVATDLTDVMLEVLGAEDVIDWARPLTPTLDMIEATKQIPFDGRTEGKHFVFGLRTAGSANPMVGVGSSQRTTGLPIAGKPTYDRLIYNTAKHVQAFELEGDVFDALRGGDESMLDSYMDIMRDQATDWRAEENKIVLGDGSGRIATLTARDNGAHTITVSDNSRLDVGRQIVIRYGTTGALLGGQAAGTALVITSKSSDGVTCGVTDEDGSTVTLSDPSAGGYYAFPYDAQGKVMNGLQIICSDSDPTTWGNSGTDALGGLLRSAQPLWAGYRLSAASAMLDVQAHLQPFLDHIRKRGAKWAKPDGRGVQWYAITGYQNFRVLEHALTVGERVPPRLKLAKDNRMYDAIDYEGAAFMIDADANPANVLTFAPATIRRWERKAPHWDDRTGSIWHRTLANDGRDADIFKAYMQNMSQLIAVCALPNGELYSTAATE
ncbi:MAG: hypothetical protein V1929_09125 [bacterium]